MIISKFLLTGNLVTYGIITKKNLAEFWESQNFQNFSVGRMGETEKDIAKMQLIPMSNNVFNKPSTRLT